MRKSTSYLMVINLLFAVVVLLRCNYSVAEEKKVVPILCGSNTYRCGDNSRCVQGKVLCDYNKDCDDYSDEQFLMCRKFIEKKGSCTSGKLHHTRLGCQDISTICGQVISTYDIVFSPLCDEIKRGLKPMEDFTAKDKELSTMRENLTALQDMAKLTDVFEYLASSFNESSSSKNDSACPPLYVNISGKCMAIFTVAKVTWAEARQFCESISGSLAILKKIKDYDSLLKQLKSLAITTSFWIGGHFTNSKSSEMPTWLWLDDKEIVMGAPYWSLYKTPNCTTRGTDPECYSYSLAPRENRDGFCLSLDYAFHYYFTDWNCHEKRSPLCFHNEK